MPVNIDEKKVTHQLQIYAKINIYIKYSAIIHTIDWNVKNYNSNLNTFPLFEDIFINNY